jgi:hypothetical protein
MPGLVARLHRSYHRLVDPAPGVDPSYALNSGDQLRLDLPHQGEIRAIASNPPRRNCRIFSRRSLSLIAAPPVSYRLRSASPCAPRVDKANLNADASSWDVR